MNIKEHINSEKGIAASDIVIGIIIIIMFISIITTIFYNYYVSAESKKRKAVATNIVIDIIENVEATKYSEVTDASIENIKKEANKQPGYKVTTTLKKYKDEAGNESKLDLIKILNVKVEYKINGKTESYEVTRLITNKGE